MIFLRTEYMALHIRCGAFFMSKTWRKERKMIYRKEKVIAVDEKNKRKCIRKQGGH